MELFRKLDTNVIYKVFEFISPELNKKVFLLEELSKDRPLHFMQDSIVNQQVIEKHTLDTQYVPFSVEKLIPPSVDETKKILVEENENLKQELINHKRMIHHLQEENELLVNEKIAIEKALDSFIDIISRIKRDSNKISL